jgi:hypothetical protein
LVIIINKQIYVWLFGDGSFTMYLASTCGNTSQESVASTESWGSAVFRKIKNLWSGSNGEKGLNQLTTGNFIFIHYL